MKTGELSPPSDLVKEGRPEWLHALAGRLTAFPRLRHIVMRGSEQVLIRLANLMRQSHQSQNREQSYREFARAMARGTGYIYGPGCHRCDAATICDGLHGDYAALFGTEEVRPIKLGFRVTDPTWYIRQQSKTVYPVS